MFPTRELWRATLALMTVAGATAAAPMTASAQALPDLVRLVLPGHPRIAEARGALAASDAEIDISRAAWRPRVFAEGGVGTQRSTGELGRSVTTFSPAIRVRQQVFDGGKSDREVEVREARVAQVRASYLSAEEDLAMSLSQAYIQLSAAQEAEAITKRWVEGLGSIESLTRQIQQIDSGRRMDMLQANSRLTQARGLLSARATAVAEAARSLDALAARHVRLVRPIALVHAPDLPSSERMMNTESMLALHPRMQVATAAIDAAKSQLELNSLYRQPTVDIEAFVASGRDADNRIRAVNTYGIQLVGTHTLLDGGGGAANVRAADSRVGQAQAAADAQARELRAALSRLIGAETGRDERLQTYESGYEQALSLRGSMREQFSFGRRPLLDLLTQESEIYQAELALSQERHDAIFDRIQLAYARGELLRALNVPSTVPQTGASPSESSQTSDVRAFEAPAAVAVAQTGAAPAGQAEPGARRQAARQQAPQDSAPGQPAPQQGTPEQQMPQEQAPQEMVTQQPMTNEPRPERSVAANGTEKHSLWSRLSPLGLLPASWRP